VYFVDSDIEIQQRHLPKLTSWCKILAKDAGTQPLQL